MIFLLGFSILVTFFGAIENESNKSQKYFDNTDAQF